MTEVKKTPDGIEIPPPGPDDVLYEVAEGIALITLNRPVVLNALNKNVQRLLDAALDRAEADDAVNVVILTGAGRSFCAGGDLYASLYPDDDPAPSGTEVQLRIWGFLKPVIAKVRGHAVGQGSELAGVCDMTIAADTAQFGEIQIRHGFGPPTLIAPFLVGMKQAKELLMLGEIVDAQDALRLGLVNRVVPEDELDAAVDAIARKLAALPQDTVRTNKVLVNRSYELAGFRDALAYRDDEAIRALSSDHGAGVLDELAAGGWAAFKQKRDALYEVDAD
jgi:enoyl-CoA hydratase/carnithine racemase